MVLRGRVSGRCCFCTGDIIIKNADGNVDTCAQIAWQQKCCDTQTGLLPNCGHDGSAASACCAQTTKGWCSRKTIEQNLIICLRLGREKEKANAARPGGHLPRANHAIVTGRNNDVITAPPLCATSNGHGAAGKYARRLFLGPLLLTEGGEWYLLR